MRVISPYPKHPLLWALEDLAGLSRRRISALARVPIRSLARLAEGYSPDAGQGASLHALLDHTRDLLAEQTAPAGELSPALLRYRRAVFDSIVEVLDSFDPRRAAEPPRESQLQSDILAAASPRGVRRDSLVAALRRQYRLRSIRRALASHPQVVQRTVDGVSWILPVDHPAARPPPALPPPTPAPRPSLHPSVSRVQTVISVYLGRASGPVPGRDAVAHAMARLGVTRTTVYRAARRMTLIRTVEGFGPDRVSLWSLPPPPPSAETSPRLESADYAVHSTATTPETSDESDPDEP